MRWQRARQSSNVEDRRRFGATGKGKLTAAGLLLALVLSVMFDQHPLEMLGLIQGSSQSSSNADAPADDVRVNFVRAILGDTEDVWTALLAQSGNQYQTPKLVLYSDRVDSACGNAGAATGPFYCSADQRIYLDLSFFDAMHDRYGGGGEFAEAYVIAHEVGHHVQHLLGVAAPAASKGASGTSVRQELQADCYAGVWAFHAQQRHHWLESGDFDAALSTAAAIGDDRLQRQSRGYVVPESFTHGTSAQRVRWFGIGFKSGDIDRCDTFSVTDL